MAYEYEMPEEFGGDSNALKEPGTYHLAVTSVLEGKGPKGSPISGFTVMCDVLSGTTAGQEGKTFNLCLFNPSLNDEPKSQAMARKKQGAFFIAANIVDPSAMGKRVSINLEAGNGHQIVAKFTRDTREGKEDQIQLNYSDIWHVDDPHCKDVPKRADAIAMIPAQFRHPAEWFEQLKPKKAGAAGGNGSGGKQQQTSQQPPAKASSVTYDDL